MCYTQKSNRWLILCTVCCILLCGIANFTQRGSSEHEGAPAQSTKLIRIASGHKTLKYKCATQIQLLNNKHLSSKNMDLLADQSANNLFCPLYPPLYRAASSTEDSPDCQDCSKAYAVHSFTSETCNTEMQNTLKNDILLVLNHHA